MSNRVFIATFESDEDIRLAAIAARREGIEIIDIYAPYAVHGLDTAMGLRPSRLPLVTFGLGLLGAVFVLGFQYWTSALDWAINVGGRPWNSLPAFVPVTFEIMVLFAGIGTVLTFIIVSGLRPWRSSNVPVARVTDDRFGLLLRAPMAGPNRVRVEEILEPFHVLAVEERHEIPDAVKNT